MKVWVGILGCVVLIFSQILPAQEQPPPLYETEEAQETLPPDLAVQPIPKPKPKPKPAAEEKPAVEGKPAVEELPAAEVEKEEPPAKIQIEKEIELPPPLPPAPEVKKVPEVPVPADLPVVKPPEEVFAIPDGGPLKEAGSDLASALAVTFARYENNFLSPADTVDTFALFTRAREGVGVVLTPKHPSSQLVCDLLGKEGELLSQTQAGQPGQTLSFQTSPMEENAILYLRVRDMQLTETSPPAELREYALELRPIAAPLAAPEGAPPPADKEIEKVEKPAEAKKPKAEAKDVPLWQNEFVQYAAAAFAAAVLMIVLVTLIRRRKKS